MSILESNYAQYKVSVRAALLKKNKESEEASFVKSKENTIHSVDLEKCKQELQIVRGTLAANDMSSNSRCDQELSDAKKRILAMSACESELTLVKQQISMMKTSELEFNVLKKENEFLKTEQERFQGKLNRIASLQESKSKDLSESKGIMSSPDVDNSNALQSTLLKLQKCNTDKQSRLEVIKTTQQELGQLKDDFVLLKAKVGQFFIGLALDDKKDVSALEKKPNNQSGVKKDSSIPTGNSGEMFATEDKPDDFFDDYSLRRQEGNTNGELKNDDNNAIREASWFHSFIQSGESYD